MFVSRILYPVQVLGPGNRIGIWMAGCVHHCLGCSNPELWDQEKKYETDANTVLELISLIAEKSKVDGFTITGGDPFYQPNALRELIPQLSCISKDILVYTGYKYEELPTDIVNQVAVIIDGKYIQSKNRGELLRGSTNQRIFIRPAYEQLYSEYMLHAENRIQNFSTSDGIISVGIHFPGYENSLKKAAISKGLEEKENG